MPICMDRHDVWETSAADVAEAHRKDLEVQDRYGVKFLTYWFEMRGTIFCLVDAPDKEAAQCVHREAHGGAAGEIVEVPLAAVEAFLGRIQDPAPPTGKAQSQMDAGHRAILFTDIVNSTEMTTRLGDRRATELIRAHDSIVRRFLAACEGREVSTPATTSWPRSPTGTRRRLRDSHPARIPPLQPAQPGAAPRPHRPRQRRAGRGQQRPLRHHRATRRAPVQRSGGRSDPGVGNHAHRARRRRAVQGREQRQLKGFAAPVGGVVDVCGAPRNSSEATTTLCFQTH